jgi:class 3 adenylate cyclase
MVFWHAPHLQRDHVERACRAALSAKAASEALNTQFAAEGLSPFAIRVGIHFGDAVVGNLGSAERMNYTVLGNSVNLAARLEGLNKGVWDHDPRQRDRSQPSRELLSLQPHRLGNRQGDDGENACL